MNETTPANHDGGSAGSVVMLSGDLLFSSRVKMAAQRAGLQFRVAGNLPEDDTEFIRFVVLDLSTRSKLTDQLCGPVQRALSRCETDCLWPACSGQQTEQSA